MRGVAGGLARGFVAGFERTNQTLNAIGTAWVLAIMVLVNADVLGRALFNRPIAGTREIVEVSIVGIVYLQIAWSLRCGRMTRSTMVVDALRARVPRLGNLAEVAIALLGAAFMLAIAWRTWPELLTAWQRNRFHGTRGVFTLPLWPFIAIVLTGTVFATVQFLLIALRHLIAVVTGEDPDTRRAEPPR